MHERLFGKENPTPETVTDLWREFWTNAGNEAGMELNTEDFPGTAESLAEHIRAGDMPIYVPPELAGQEDRHLLGQMWPEMRSHSVRQGNLVTNEQDRSGWQYVEAAPNAPHRGTSESELAARLTGLGREGMNLTGYIIASQMSRLQTGRYFDEDTWSRLLGSCEGGQVVSASFDAYGGLDVDPYWDPRIRRGGLGGRSSEGVV